MLGFVQLGPKNPDGQSFQSSTLFQCLVILIIKHVYPASSQKPRAPLFQFLTTVSCSLGVHCLLPTGTQLLGLAQMLSSSCIYLWNTSINFYHLIDAVSWVLLYLQEGCFSLHHFTVIMQEIFKSCIQDLQKACISDHENLIGNLLEQTKHSFGNDNAA